MTMRWTHSLLLFALVMITATSCRLAGCPPKSSTATVEPMGQTGARQTADWRPVLVALAREDYESLLRATHKFQGPPWNVRSNAAAFEAPVAFLMKPVPKDSDDTARFEVVAGWRALSDGGVEDVDGDDLECRPGCVAVWARERGAMLEAYFGVIWGTEHRLETRGLIPVHYGDGGITLGKCCEDVIEYG